MLPGNVCRAGTSVQFGQTSVISSNGVFIAVGTAANNNGYYNLVYMYKKDVVTGRFRCVQQQRCAVLPAYSVVVMNT